MKRLPIPKHGRRFALAVFCLLPLVPFAGAEKQTEGPRLERIKYNYPGLTVDLGVGLWAGPLPMDFDGDGTLDLVVSGHDKPSNGLYFFRNPSGGTSKNPLPIFEAGRRISQGQANAQVSYMDGKPHVLTPGMAYPDFLHSGFAHPVKLPVRADFPPGKVRANAWSYVDFDGDGNADLIVGADDWTEYGWDNGYDAEGRWTRGPLHGSVYLLRNLGTTARPEYGPAVKVEAAGQPIDTYGWPFPNFADFRGTGKLDLICGEFLDGFTFYENIGTRTEPRYAAGRRLKTAAGQPLVMDLEMIHPTTIDWNQDGHPDLIVGDEDGRVALLENTGRLAADGTPQFLPPRYFQQTADEVKFGGLATPVSVDWNGDGALDLLAGNTAGYIGYFQNLSGPGVEKPKWAAPKLLEAEGRPIRIQAGPNGSIQGPAEAKWGYTTLSAADWDGDGLPDLVVNSIWGRVIWYRNAGTRAEPKLAAAQPIEVQWEGPAPTLAWGWLKPHGQELLTQWRTTPVVIDWNRDGLADLVMLDCEGYLALFPRARREGQLVLLPPQRVFCDEKGEPLCFNRKAAGGSGRRKLSVVDWDGDGRLDILINSQNAEWWQQTGSHDGKWFFANRHNLDSLPLAGHDTSPTTVDWNGDGVPDLLVGAEDGRFYYLQNPHKARLGGKQ